MYIMYMFVHMINDYGYHLFCSNNHLALYGATGIQDKPLRYRKDHLG